MTNDPARVIEVLEQEFVFLARALEAINRKRSYPLERAHYLLLLQLRDGPLTVTTLAGRLALDDSTVTRQVAAMKDLGLVRKTPNPEDRRSALVEQTPEGASRADVMRTLRLSRIAALFEDWDVEEQAALGSMMERLNQSLAVALEMLDRSNPEGGE